MKRNALIGSIFAGYGHAWNNFYLSGELTLSNSTYKMTSAANKTLITNLADILTNASYETMNSEVNVSPTQFGVFARPGLLLTPNSLLYARIGTSFAMIKTMSTLFSTKQLIQTSTPPPTVVLNEPITTQASVHARRAAFQIGGGIEQAINEKFTVRMDYLFSNYGTIQAQTTQATVTPYPLTATTHQKIALREQSIMLGLTYQFG